MINLFFLILYSRVIFCAGFKLGVEQVCFKLREEK